VTAGLPLHPPYRRPVPPWERRPSPGVSPFFGFSLGLTPPVSGGPQTTDPQTGKKRALWAVRSTGMLGPVCVGGPSCLAHNAPPTSAGVGGTSRWSRGSLALGVSSLGVSSLEVSLSWGVSVFMALGLGSPGLAGAVSWRAAVWRPRLGVFSLARKGLTPGVRRGEERERGTSGRCSPSPANPCSAPQGIEHLTQTWGFLAMSLQAQRQT
jgi:hypothetical protein